MRIKNPDLANNIQAENERLKTALEEILAEAWSDLPVDGLYHSEAQRYWAKVSGRTNTTSILRMSHHLDPPLCATRGGLSHRPVVARGRAKGVECQKKKRDKDDEVGHHFMVRG